MTERAAVVCPGCGTWLVVEVEAHEPTVDGTPVELELGEVWDHVTCAR